MCLCCARRGTQGWSPWWSDQGVRPGSTQPAHGRLGKKTTRTAPMRPGGLQVPRRRRPRKPSRFLPMIHQDLLVVPKAALSGRDEVDSKNIVIVELYNAISKLLEQKHNRALLAKVTKCEDLICYNEAEVRGFSPFPWRSTAG